MGKARRHTTWHSSTTSKFKEYILTKVTAAHLPTTDYDPKKHTHYADTLFSIQKVTRPDGRTRYYKGEIPSDTPRKTRGASYVIEYNPTTGKSRAWNECYDHQGGVNRVHPKQINGQQVTSQHYPPTIGEL